MPDKPDASEHRKFVPPTGASDTLKYSLTGTRSRVVPNVSLDTQRQVGPNQPDKTTGFQIALALIILL
jgi:hypothetical protein